MVTKAASYQLNKQKKTSDPQEFLSIFSIT